MSFSVVRKFLEKQEVIFNMYIDQLPIEMRKQYEELAIFREDVNITPQVRKLDFLEHIFFYIEFY